MCFNPQSRKVTQELCGGTKLPERILNLIILRFAWEKHGQFGKNCKTKPKAQLKKVSRLCLQGTRKKGCPAHITIREFILYPDYKVNQSRDLNNHQLRSLRESVIHELQRDKRKGSAKSISKYYVCLPSRSSS